MKDLTYESASEELEKILQDLESGKVGIDQLATKVERAGELLKFCSNKLKDTELKVSKIIEELDL